MTSQRFREVVLLDKPQNRFESVNKQQQKRTIISVVLVNRFEHQYINLSPQNDCLVKLIP